MPRAWYKIDPKRIWQVSGLFLYALLLFGLFLFWTFPYAVLQQRLLVALQSALSCRVEVRHGSFLFPFGLRWEGVSIYLPERETPWLLDRAEARAELLPLLLGWRGEINWSLRAAGGQGVGHLRIVRRGDGLHFRLDETRADVELGAFTKQMSGTVHLTLEGEWAEKGRSGAGDARIEGEKLVLQDVPELRLPVSAIRFTRLSGRILLKETRLVLEGMTAQGDQADFSGGGNVLIRIPYPGSLLSLSFRVTPKGNLSQLATLFVRPGTRNDPLEVSITGTLGDPKVQVNGIALN